MNIEEKELNKIERTLKKYNLYDKKIITIIINNLPEPYCSIEDFRSLKKRCFEELGLREVAEFEE